MNYLGLVDLFRPSRQGCRSRTNLGYMCAEGQGVPQDYVRRAHVVQHVSGAGQPNCGENQDNVAQRMTPAQIAEAA
jgi:hypothetical protein